MNCIIIPDKEMNDYITRYGKNLTFVWCEQYTTLVDFVNGKRYPERDVYDAIVPHFINIYGDDEAKKIVGDAVLHNILAEVTQIYHDTSRKVYIITYQTSPKQSV